MTKIYTVRDARREKIEADSRRWMKAEKRRAIKADGIRTAYREDCTIGYDTAMRDLMSLGYTEIEADDILVPIPT